MQFGAAVFCARNHDGESAGRGSMAWATATRKALFPNPTPSAFYTGNKVQEPNTGTPDDYYAWHWGDAQFLVLILTAIRKVVDEPRWRGRSE